MPQRLDLTEIDLSHVDEALLEQALQKQLRAKQKLEATRSLIAFTEWTFPRYRTAGVHREIAEHLERVERGEIDRLMLLCPPRHGKSELASRRFPAYYLGRRPQGQFISASASADLAEDFGRDVRNIISSQEYTDIFDTRLAEDSQAKGKWSTSQGGSFYAVGVGSAVMGRGADVFLIDDPFGKMEEAQSEIERKRRWEWYGGTVYNRLQKNGAIVIINHRTHEDDLSGRLLAQQAAGGDVWTVVELKATPEKPLWPEEFSAEALARIKANTQPSRFWSALYEQNPIPDEGTYFSSEWLKPYLSTQLPDRRTMQVYGASDYAVTDDGGDWTVHLVVGFDVEERLWLLDMWRGQKTPDVWVDAFCDLVIKWKPIGWAEETGQIKSAVGPFLEKRTRERKAYVARAVFPTRGDKSIRAQSIRGRMAVNGLHVPAFVEWMPEFQAELMSFPAGKHDDIVDALGLVGQVIDRMIPGRPVPEEKKPKVLSTNPGETTITMNELWEANERRHKRSAGRIA